MKVVNVVGIVSQQATSARRAKVKVLLRVAMHLKKSSAVSPDAHIVAMRALQRVERKSFKMTRRCRVTHITDRP